ncbi:tetratricopeptide repeat protein [Variovorax sp. PCZ-1]|uniref:tetratricopeptide repeat protein n=1 Tax=Variovorax sp. PCZ-1 TaxID=2835533 RepID=UPI001BCAB82C|nr:tetratricopeptide repeat protein [Variovorax sp. PCZ-1]MBS7807649.1 sel1 repeat family protein [Variovorax sp. PCZ-1]
MKLTLHIIFILTMLLGSISTVSFSQIKTTPKSRADPSPTLQVTANPQESAQDSSCESQPSLEGSIARHNGKQPTGRVDEALVARARTGDAAAAWRLALASFRGECRAPNYSEMAVYIQIAHQAGHACASGALGLAHARGWGVRRDLTYARELIERSIQAGCTRAYYWSWLADEAAPNPSARERARSDLAQGADRNDGHALNALAVQNEIDQQRNEARKLYLRAANVGNATARLNLARLARFFSQSSEKPTMTSLQQRAQSGEAQAQYQLARRLHQGDGVSPDYVQALKWYSQSAAKGHTAAREMLQLVQARLGNAALASLHTVNISVMSDLANVDLAQDELNKRRGITQPIEDTDPFLLL